MNSIEIYSKSYCPFCHCAKALLDAKSVDYQEYELSSQPALEQEMRERSGRTSVPQVFINNHHIGGSDELADAQASGLLDELLSAKNKVTA